MKHLVGARSWSPKRMRGLMLPCVVKKWEGGMHVCRLSAATCFPSFPVSWVRNPKTVLSCYPLHVFYHLALFFIVVGCQLQNELAFLQRDGGICRRCTIMSNCFTVKPHFILKSYVIRADKIHALLPSYSRPWTSQSHINLRLQCFRPTWCVLPVLLCPPSSLLHQLWMNPGLI